MNRLFHFLFIGSLLCSRMLVAQEVYTVDISKAPNLPISGHLRLGTHTNTASHSLDANSLYFIRDGKPWYPVMGEMHFSRYPRQRWEESILKMKAAGIDVIATYIFWLYHEEVEGRFNWDGNNDLHYFIELCKKHHVSVLVRIGPWCHGEVRNGGLPDWIIRRGNIRKNDSAYLGAVKQWFGAIAGQLLGLYFKDNGPIIGAQIENEFRFNNPAGLNHILTLKRMAVAAGIDVPYYTATAWQGANLTQDELVPVWGAYPEAPWSGRTTQLPLSENYLFILLRNDPAIGSDLLGQRKEDAADYKGYRYPYATAEMGGGIQITYHRRPIITPQDVAAMAYNKVGSGANLMGYYMFHGGAHPIGQHSTFQESRATNYPNDYPIISYDFQAPIGETGQLKSSYRWFKVLHYFLNDFGDSLVQYNPYFPEQKPYGPSDSATLRFAVRARGNHGFVFISNYQRQLQLPLHKDVQIQMKTPDNGIMAAFSRPITIPSGVQAILPFNMDIGGAHLVSATVQPLCQLSDTIPTYVFFQPEGLQPGYLLEKKGIQTITATHATVLEKEGTFSIAQLTPGLDCSITVKLTSGKTVRMLTLTQQQALDSWVGELVGKTRLLITGQNVIFNNDTIQLQSTGDATFDLSVYPGLPNLTVGASTARKLQNSGIFSRFTWRLPAQEMQVSAEPVTEITAYQNKGLPLPADDRNEKNTAARPGPQYQTNLQSVMGSKYWKLRIPATKYPCLLTIDYSGDTGAAYEGGKLFSDDFYFGKDWQIAVPASSSAREILLQIVPFSPERDVYFEKGVSERIHADGSASLRSVRLQSLYSLSLSCSK